MSFFPRGVVVVALAVLAGCGARTGIAAPPRCDVASDCPEPADFCGSVAVCLAGYCGLSGPRDCADDSACTDDACDGAARACVHPLRDRDDDAFGDGSCGGDDCDDHDAASHPGAAERCTGGHDEDCDGRTDCSDSDCSAAAECAMCMPEVCSGGRDEDCDAMRDCTDGDCAGRPPCCTDAETACDDARDDDCDGAIDCLDTDCAHAPTCCIPRAETCNGVDDDCDGTIDDGVPCYTLDGAPLRAIATGLCGEAWYAYDHPDGASANPAPDVRRLDEVVVAIVESPASCGGPSIAIIDGTARNGTGGTLHAQISVTPGGGRILQSDEPGECQYDGASGRGTCDWEWQPCCTDGVILGAFSGDFCMTLGLTAPSHLSDVLVLDGASATLTRGFGTAMVLCARTIPAVP